MSQLLPWQQGTWAELIARERSGRLPHALLFTGPVGVGKLEFARLLARSLLCTEPLTDGQDCGKCHACGLLNAGTHPDLRMVEPEEEGKAIPVDKIRSVGEFFALTSQYCGRQVVIIQPAEAMNRFSANSLLKTLEEPSAGALLILISSKPSQLLATIRSRCQQVAFGLPEHSQALAWLQPRLSGGVDTEALLALADGGPLEAIRLSEEGGLEARQSLMAQWAGLLAGRDNPLEVAAQWAQWGMPRSLQWLSSWITDLIRLKSGASADVISNKDLGPQLQKMAETLDSKALYAYLDQLTDYSRWLGGQINVQLALEDLMITWSRCARRSR